MVWDYHVVLLSLAAAEPRPSAPPGSGWEVWDLDSTLGAPVPAARWLAATFPPDAGTPPELQPLFRLVEADELAAAFASDRSHMRRPDGSFLQEPPPWPAILPPGVAPSLMRFVDMEERFAGSVTDLRGLCELLLPRR